MFFKLKHGKIESFDLITLHTSGMRFMTDHEITCKDGKAQITRYNIRYTDGEKERVIDKQAVCGTDEIIKLLNDCAVMSWDGFHGKHPRGVKDGTMFRFKATVNEKTEIYADGSQNFPKHYRDFTDGLYLLLNKKEEQ